MESLQEETKNPYEVLFGYSVIPFFLVVGGTTSQLVSFAGGSPVVVGISVSAMVLLALICWLLFAPYARDIWQMPRVVLTLVYALLYTTLAFMLRGFKPEFPQWTLQFELTRATLRALRSGPLVTNFVKSANARYFNQLSLISGTLNGPKSCKKYGTKMELMHFNGLEHVWIRDHDRTTTTTTEKERFIVFYYHGGGFTLFTPHFYTDWGNYVRAAIMKIIHEEHPEMQNVSVECFLANYRKAPDFPYPRPQEDAVAVYEHIVKTENIDPSRIVIMGDSAGGGLCLTTMLRLKDKQGPMPAGAVVSCPFADFKSMQGADDAHDLLPLHVAMAMLTVFMPTRHDEDTWGDATPVYRDLSGLPPALLQIGDKDTLYWSMLKLHKKAVTDGLEKTWKLDVHQNMPHAFTILPESALPEGIPKGIDRTARFAIERFQEAYGSRR